MNLKVINELLKGWVQTGFTIECAGCEGDESEILTVYPSENVVECIGCGNLFQVLDIFIDKLRELNE